MRIVIVGAGIGGLSSYLFLVKHVLSDNSSQHSINIYESYDIFSTRGSLRNSNGEPCFMLKAAGGGIGIGRNGLSILGRIDSDGQVLQRLQSKGHPISKWKMGSARGRTIIDADIASKQKTGEIDTRSAAEMVMIARYNVWEALRDEVLKHDSKAVIRKKLVKLESLATGRVQLEFEDGYVDTADLIIGADGLRSFVRRTMFEHNNDLQPATWSDWLLRSPQKKQDYITPHFEGLVGLGGFVPGEVLKQSGFQKGSMAVTFGSNGFFGYGFLGESPDPEKQAGSTRSAEGIAGWWSTFSCSDPKMFQMTETQETPEPSEQFKTVFDKEAALSSLMNRHQSWQDPTIKNILQYVAENRALEHTYPTYTTPELPTWQMNGNVVLVGDAAHALQPSSGQGASQALEDAESLALFLKHHLQSAKIASMAEPETRLSRERQAVARALSKFVQFRKPRIAKIYEHSQKMSQRKADMNIVQEFIMYFFIWLSSKLQLMQKLNNEVLEYDLPAEVAIAIHENDNLCTLHDVADQMLEGQR